MDLLIEAKNRLGTYRAVAKYLGVTEGFISQVRHGKSKLSPFLIAKLAELCERNPIEALLQALEEQAEKKSDALRLRRWSKNLVSRAAAVFVAVGLSFNYSSDAMAISQVDEVSHDRSGSTDYSMRPRFRRTAGPRPYIKAVFRRIRNYLRDLWGQSGLARLETSLFRFASGPLDHTARDPKRI